MPLGESVWQPSRALTVGNRECHNTLARSAVIVLVMLPLPLWMLRLLYMPCNGRLTDICWQEIQRWLTTCNSGSQNYNKSAVPLMVPRKDRMMNQQQLDTNTDALAPATMPTIDADAGVQPLADRIKSAFDDALTELIAKRDQLYAAAIAPLEQEGNKLSKEYDELEAGIQAIEVTLPAKERVIRHEVDLLMVSGAANAKQDAKAKMDELKELQHKPVVMRQRLGAIHDRFLSINQKKHNIAKEVFQEWYSECQHVIRSGEHGLFVTMLGGIEKSMYEFQTRTGTERSGVTGGLFHQGHIIGLTADEKSQEWQAARHWYR
jgi:hypothetical protein